MEGHGARMTVSFDKQAWTKSACASCFNLASSCRCPPIQKLLVPRGPLAKIRQLAIYPPICSRLLWNDPSFSHTSCCACTTQKSTREAEEGSLRDSREKSTQSRRVAARSRKCQSSCLPRAVRALRIIEVHQVHCCPRGL